MSLVTEVIEQISEKSESHGDEISSAIHSKMLEILDDLMADNSDFFAVTVSSIDGLAWAERISPDFDKHRFAAMSSSLLAISDELANEVGKERTNNVIIEGGSGKILIIHAGQLLLLTVFTRGGVTLGMALSRAKQAAMELESMHV